jgi:alcohol dehydrogenase
MNFIEKHFSFTMPTKTIFGTGIVENLGQEAVKYGKKALIVSDKDICSTEMFEITKAALEKRDIKTVVFSDVVPNPVDVDMYSAIDNYKRNDCDMLIAIGGGSSIDSAKAIGALITNGGKIQDLAGEGAIKNPIPPLIAIPTTAGTGSEVTSYSVITDSQSHEKLLLWDLKLLPDLAILDPKMTISCPPNVTAGCGMDALTHAIESYITKISNPICDAPACHAIELTGKYIERVFKDGHDIEARGGMLLGSNLAGMAFANINLAAVHTMAKVAGGFYNLPHGISIAIFLPYVTDYNLDAIPEKYAKIAGLLGVDTHGLSDMDAAQKAVEHIKHLIRTLNIPTFASLGAKPEDFDQMSKLCKQDSCDPINPKPISETTYIQLYQMAYENAFNL